MEVIYLKKTLKIIVLIAIMLVAVLALTGCGNKLVATKDVEGTSTEPKHSEKIEISFKNDKVNKVKMTYTFDNKDDAKKFVDSYNAILSLANAFASGDEKVSLPTMEQKGKKAIMEMDAKMYSEMGGDTEAGMTKDEVKASLEEEGYKVK